VPDLIEDAARELYAVPPDDFMRRRTELADAARKKGDGASATAIGKLRKPTVGAWIVNALVLDDASIVDRLTDLGDRLRAAQDRLDAAKLRELTDERRKLVDELTTAAFRKADRTQPPAGLRDEVTGTFDAAIADADVAARLGQLQRAEQWSGFGFLPTGAPQLSVVRGGKDEQPRRAAKATAKPKVSAAEKRKLQRALATAQSQFDTANAALDEAQRTERDLDRELRKLTKQLAKIQQRVEEARTELEQARKEVTAARGKRREARSALDKAEREADV
jgi:predicted  nucleic acid-binding Zn-ribbon protein